MIPIIDKHISDASALDDSMDTEALHHLKSFYPPPWKDLNLNLILRILLP